MFEVLVCDTPLTVLNVVSRICDTCFVYTLHLSFLLTVNLLAPELFF